MNSTHAKISSDVFADPVNGNMARLRIEGAGSSRMTFECDDVRLYVHRPHPQNESLRCRVRDVRQFLMTIGVKP